MAGERGAAGGGEGALVRGGVAWAAHRRASGGGEGRVAPRGAGATQPRVRTFVARMRSFSADKFTAVPAGEVGVGGGRESKQVSGCYALMHRFLRTPRAPREKKTHGMAAQPMRSPLEWRGGETAVRQTLAPTFLGEGRAAAAGARARRRRKPQKAARLPRVTF